MNVQQMETHPAFLFLFYYYYNFRRITGEEAINLVWVFLQYHPRHSFSYITGHSAWICCWGFFCEKGVSCVFFPLDRNENHRWLEEAGFASLTLRHTHRLSLPGSVMKRLEIHPPQHQQEQGKQSRQQGPLGLIKKSTCQTSLAQKSSYWRHLS